MKVVENLVGPASEYFIYTPTQEAAASFLYPICIGHFFYLPHYSLCRSSYDSLLIMHVRRGSCTIKSNGGMVKMSQGNTVLINCYEKHGYESEEGWEADWVHIDGPCALKYYEHICRTANTTIPVLPHAPAGLDRLIASFSHGAIPPEPAMSMLLTRMLSEYLSFSIPEGTALKDSADASRDAVSAATGYISSHFAEELSVDRLASLVHLSSFYFIRLFKERTGCTPHEYLANTRISHAKYLLKNTSLTIKEICFASGFASESRFCTCFKASVGVRPSEYRGTPD